MGEPLRQFESSALRGIDLRLLQERDRRQEPARHAGAEFLGLAADAELRVADGRRLAHAERRASRRRRIGEPHEFLLNRVDLLAGRL